MATKDTTTEIPVTIEAHSNNMKGPAFDVQNPVNRLRICAASCLFGEPAYYLGEKNPGERKQNMTERLDKRVMDYLVDILSGIITPHEVHENSPSKVMEDTIDKALDYDFDEYKTSKLIKLDILINGEPLDALSTIMHIDKSY